MATATDTLPLEYLQLLVYVNGAGVAILFYDYFLTFTREVSLVWVARWNYMKVLFLLARYMPFFDAALHIYNRAFRSPTAESCLVVFKITTWLIYIGIAIPEVILTLRAWAVWERDRRLTIALPILFVTCWAPNIGIIILFLKSVAFVPIPIATLSCGVTSMSKITYICWILLLTYETLIFFLMLIQGIRCYKRGGRSELIDVVFRDGFLCYTILFAFAFANVVVPPEIRAGLILAQRFLHSIIACRVILDIRSQAMNTANPAWLDIPQKSRLEEPPILLADVIDDDRDERCGTRSER